MKQKLTSVDEHLQEWLKNPRNKRRWELRRDTARIAVEIMKYRVSYNLTQSQAAKKLGMFLWELKAFENFEEEV